MVNGFGSNGSYMVALRRGTAAKKEAGSTMLDLVSILAIAGMFALGCLYVRGCDCLKEVRP